MDKRLKTEAIIPTAGLGTRMNLDEPKPLVLLDGKPLIVYTIQAFEQSPCIDSVVLVCHKKTLEEFKALVKDYGLKKVKHFVAGGETRCDSVGNGLAKLDEDTEIVVVHDGARPLVEAGLINRIVEACYTDDAVVAGVKIKSTIKEAKGDPVYVASTLNRDDLWEIQTPQAFQKEVLLKAHQQRGDFIPTDDAALAEKIGIKVRIVEGNYNNIKITTREDLIVAKAFLGNRQ